MTSLKELHHIPYSPSDESWTNNIGIFHHRSMNAMNREHNKIGEFKTISGKTLQIYKNKSTNTISAGYEVMRDDNVKAFKTVTWLEFKTKHTIVNIPTDIDERKILQVNKVHTIADYRDQGIALYLYALLAYNGYIIVSDEDHYDGGVALWKSMARQAKLYNYKINVLNVLSGYLTDDNNKVISYDVKNIDDAEIWTSGHDFSGRYILLVLRKL